MTTNDKPDMRLALILQAIDDLESDFAEEKKDYAARKEVLINQKRALQRDIITGQRTLLDVADALDGMTIDHGNGLKATITVKKNPEGEADAR